MFAAAVLLGLQENLSVKCITASIDFPTKKETKSSGNDLACLPDEGFILSPMILIFLESIKRSARRLSEGQTKQHTFYTKSMSINRDEEDGNETSLH